jgi:hypothetical protein
MTISHSLLMICWSLELETLWQNCSSSRKMKSKFILTDQGDLQYYLGIEVSKMDENTLPLHLMEYAEKIYIVRNLRLFYHEI